MRPLNPVEMPMEDRMKWLARRIAKFNDPLPEDICRGFGLPPGSTYREGFHACYPPSRKNKKARALVFEDFTMAQEIEERRAT